MKDLRNVSFSLDRDETTTVLKQSRKLKSGVDAMILSALSWCFRWAHGHDVTLISLESHGRADLFDDVDISGTVGWFTAQYPFPLEAPRETESPEMAVKSIKHRLDGVPNLGVGWGVLKYMVSNGSNSSISTSAEPDINVNYLGEFENYGQELFVPAKEETGTPVSPNAPVIHDIDINAVIAEKKLHMIWHYNGNRFSRTFISEMIDHFRTRLNDLTVS